MLIRPYVFYILLFLNDFYYICIVKRVFDISVILFSVLLLACGKQQETVVEQPLPFIIDKNLQQIDSLMQHDADSALVLLLTAQHQNDFNKNYQSLLISEALYKTYNPQLNRHKNETFQETSLQEAIHYFDSLYAGYPQNDDLAILSARSHYMNGVGFYENDSVVDACKEYLHTLEIMEDHFEEKDLVGYKAKFMSLAYGRLSELFADQFMSEPSICCSKKALHYRQIMPTSKYGISNTFYRIGLQYDIQNQSDSAYHYYKLAFENLQDSNNLVYRNLIASTTMSSYGIEQNAEKAINNLNQIINATDNIEEKTSRYLSVGYIYYNERDFDSAVVYFKSVFENSNDALLRFQSAEYLRNIYLSFGDTIKAKDYDTFLANNAISQYDKMMEVSVLDQLFNGYLNQQKHSQTNPNTKSIVYIFTVITIVATLIIIVIISRKNRKIKNCIIQYGEEKDKVTKLKQKFVGKRSETELRIEAFLNEPVCCKINEMICDIPISARSHYSNHLEIKLDDEAIIELGKAVAKHFPNFKTRLISIDNNLKNDDLLLCYLYLLGLDNTQIKQLLHCSHSTVSRHAGQLKKSFKGCRKLSIFLKKLAIS